MKKILAIIMIIAMAAFAMAGCDAAGSGGSGAAGRGSGGQAVSEIVNVAVLNGPTGMGAVQLIDMTDKYNVESYEAPTDIAPKLISGEVDVAALPSNMAAVLYNKTGGKVVAVTPVTLGVLYIVENVAGGAKNAAGGGIKDLKALKGKTIVSSGQGGTPEYALQKVLESAGFTLYEDVQVQWLASHADVNQKLLSEPGTIAMVPEPFVSAALMQAGAKAEQNDAKTRQAGAKAAQGSVKILFDMNKLWEDATGQEFPMGVLVARADFAQKRGADLEVLLTDLKSSVEFVNRGDDEAAQLIVDKGFLGDATVAKAAIPGCRIVCYGGESGGTEASRIAEGMEMLKVFNKTLFEMNPEALGGKLPGNDLYYKAK